MMQICGAFCDTMRAKYAGMEDCGIMLIAVNATDHPNNIRRQTMVLGDGAALTYGFLQALQDDDSPVLELLKNTADICKFNSMLHAFGHNSDDNDNEG